jgi:hypothetical protein
LRDMVSAKQKAVPLKELVKRLVSASPHS